jgi:hypothetical protein
MLVLIAGRRWRAPALVLKEPPVWLTSAGNLYTNQTEKSTKSKCKLYLVCEGLWSNDIVDLWLPPWFGRRGELEGIGGENCPLDADPEVELEESPFMNRFGLGVLRLADEPECCELNEPVDTDCDSSPCTTSPSPRSRFHPSRPPTSSIGILFKYFRNACSFITRTNIDKGELPEPKDVEVSSQTATMSNWSRCENSLASPLGAMTIESSNASAVTLKSN